MLATLALAACNRAGSASHQAEAPPTSGLDESGYLRPPQVQGAQRAADGGVMLSGRSGPLVRVRLSSPPPINTAYGATADAKGDWTIAIPAASDVRLVGLAEELVGRDVQGEGYIAILPAPGPAGALLRGGGGASVLVGPSALRIAAVDYDGSGATVVSGLARPGAPARLFVDDSPAGEARVTDRGRFSISVTVSLKPGDHTARIDCADETDTVKFSVDPPRPVNGLPYRGERTPSGWRIDWLTPGGGEQTTLIFDKAES
ncbi:MAG TPA: hypothetical protein VHY34_01385 [Caulobacteraceae bacterium]|nr:hypothetical protein [Caulobacteraceae bacterium]